MRDERTELRLRTKLYALQVIGLSPDHKNRKAAKPLRESHKRIASAALVAADFVSKAIVSGLSRQKEGEQLHRWLDFIKDGLRVIWVQVGGMKGQRSRFVRQ